jgi:hypothetical protein
VRGVGDEPCLRAEGVVDPGQQVVEGIGEFPEFVGRAVHGYPFVQVRDGHAACRVSCGGRHRDRWRGAGHGMRWHRQRVDAEVLAVAAVGLRQYPGGGHRVAVTEQRVLVLVLVLGRAAEAASADPRAEPFAELGRRAGVRADAGGLPQRTEQVLRVLVLAGPRLGEVGGHYPATRCEARPMVCGVNGSGESRGPLSASSS